MVENRMSDTKKRILQEARDFVYRELKDDSSGGISFELPITL